VKDVIICQELIEKGKCEYIKDCPLCTMKTTVLAKADDDPEYYAEIWVQCSCGNCLSFDIPVN
jgi:hypothetical protein